MSTPAGKYTAKDWDEVRMGFHTSIMVDTSLNSLAQNLDLGDWPVKGGEETPAKYIDLTYEELHVMQGLNGHPERVDMLITVLRETLAFDNPFGDMVEQAAEAADKDNPLSKNLSKLEIPLDFPIDLMVLSAETKEFCRLEKIATLGEFADFAQNMPPHVIVGGDFRRLLNAVAHVNEEVLATVLPFRVGTKGLHLLEALNQLIEAHSEGERLALAKRLGRRLKPEEEAKARSFDSEHLQRMAESLRLRAAPLFQRFKGERDALIAAVNAGTSLERSLMVLHDPLKESLVAALVAPVIRGPGGAPAAPKKGGLAGFFSRLFKRQ
jgi:hypothetical protein